MALETRANCSYWPGAGVPGCSNYMHMICGVEDFKAEKVQGDTQSKWVSLYALWGTQSQPRWYLDDRDKGNKEPLTPARSSTWPESAFVIHLGMQNLLWLGTTLGPMLEESPWKVKFTWPFPVAPEDFGLLGPLSHELQDWSCPS